MTTPDHSSDPGTAPQDRPADELDNAREAASGSHSAPRPVPPGFSAADEETVTVPAASTDPAEPAEATAPSAPTRISAFPSERAEQREAPDGDASTSVTAPLPALTTPEGDPTPSTPSPAAGSLAGAVNAADGVTTTTRVIPAGSTVPLADPGSLTDPDSLAGSTAGRLKEQAREPFPEAEWVEKPTKRTAAHLWGLLATLALVPIAWFLLTDGALRTSYSLLEIGDRPNIAGLLSLAGGLGALLVVALVARASSLGAWIWGSLVTAAGIVFLAIPATVMQWLADNRDAFLVVHDGFGTNLYNYLLDTGRSGLLLTFGVIVLLFALVSHTARRSGRTEGRIAAEAAARGD